MNRFSLATFPIQNKTIFLRVDFNVPLEKGKIVDSRKISASLPTIKYLLSQNCKIVLATHLGRPRGKYNPELRIAPLAKELRQLLPKQNITYLSDSIGKEIKQKIQQGKPKDIFFLENLRFYKEEEENDLAFAHSLAELAEISVNDAFASYHPHASVEAITRFLPSIAGLLMEKEILSLQKGLKPKPPSVWLLGGGKITKIEIIAKALKTADYILLAGALPFPFLKARHYSIGMSKSDYQSEQKARQLLWKRAAKKLIFPLDFVITRSFSSHSRTSIVPFNQIPTASIALDIGPETIKLYKKYLRKAHTIIWNGPVGYFEWAKFATATRELGKFIGSLTAISLCGGGETEEAIHKFHLEHGLTHISTGGGAMTDFLTGKKLPIIAALERNYKKFKWKI